MDYIDLNNVVMIIHNYCMTKEEIKQRYLDFIQGKEMK